MLNQKPKRQTELLRKLKFTLLILGIFLFAQGLERTTSFLDLDITFYLWFMPITAIVIVVLMVQWMDQRWLKAINNLKKLSQEQKKGLKKARRTQIILLITAILVLVGGGYYNLWWEKWASSFRDAEFYSWFTPIALSIMLILMVQWMDQRWLNIVNNLGKLTQREKRYIEWTRKFHTVGLIIVVLFILAGLYLNLMMYRIMNSSFDIKFYFMPISVLGGLIILIAWYNEHIWLKIVDGLKKEINKNSSKAF